MGKTYNVCEYHGRYEVREEHDWQCPKCEKEILDYGAWRSGRHPSPRTGTNILLRAGVINHLQKSGIDKIEQKLRNKVR